MANKLFSFLILLFLCQYSYAQRIYHVAVGGNDNNPGTAGEPLRTISAAAKLAKPGETVWVHAGIYREWVRPVSGRVTFEAAAGEKVIIKGSEIIIGWQQVNGTTWKVIVPDSLALPYKQLIQGDWYFGRGLHTGEVYLDGKALHEVTERNEPADQPVNVDTTTHLSARYTWYTAQENNQTVIYANFQSLDPNTHIIEINVRPSCFYPAHTGVNDITVRGFEMCQAATQWAAPTAEQIGIIGTNWSKGWTIENNTIHDSKCVGITLGKDRASGQDVWLADPSKDGSVLYNDMVLRVIAEGWNKDHIGSHLVRDNEVFDCGAAGICGSFGAAYSKIVHNDVHDIYTYRPYWGAEMGGIKIHAAIDVLIADNRVSNCYQGIWLDWMAQGTRVTRNVCYDNDYVDYFPEVDHGPYLADHNYFLSGFSIKDWSEGGAYVSNLIAGMVSRAPQGRQTPWFKPHTTIYAGKAFIQGGDNRFYNNIFIGHPAKFRRTRYMAPDAIDDHSGYGLELYNDATLPVKAGGNIYLNGAKPLAGEKNPLVMDADPALKINASADQITLHVSTKLMSGNQQLFLGKTLVSRAAFPQPEGTPLLLGEQTVTIWTK